MDEQKPQETVTISMERFEQMREAYAELQDDYFALSSILKQYMEVEQGKDGFMGLFSNCEVTVHLDRIVQYIREEYEMKPFKTIRKIKFLLDAENSAEIWINGNPLHD